MPSEKEKTKEEAKEEEPEKPKYETIEDLPGVGPATAEKLQELGFQTVESLAIATIKELVPAGIGEKQAGIEGCCPGNRRKERIL